MNATVIGRRELSGSCEIGGFKHSAVLCVAASTMASKSVALKNVPNIGDIPVFEDLINSIGANCSFKGNEFEICSQEQFPEKIRLSDPRLPLVHGPIYLAIALLARAKEVSVGFTGGCKIGDRSLKKIEWVLGRFGVRTSKKKNGFVLSRKRLRSASIDLSNAREDTRSSATKAALFLGACSRKRTIITNPYVGAEINDLACLLNKIGASVSFEGDSIMVRRDSRNADSKTVFSLAPDLLEFGTFAAAVGTAGGKVTLKNFDINSAGKLCFSNEIGAFNECGLVFEQKGAGVSVSVERLKAIHLSSPPIYSDLQPIFSALLANAIGRITIKDFVWRNRFAYVPEMAKLGAKIQRFRNSVRIFGPSDLVGAEVEANDLRAAAALLVLGLNARGETTVSGVEHIDRGYEDFFNKMRELGAHVIV